jgi:hypothetical protein
MQSCEEKLRFDLELILFIFDGLCFHVLSYGVNDGEMHGY